MVEVSTVQIGQHTLRLPNVKLTTDQHTAILALVEFMRGSVRNSIKNTAQSKSASGLFMLLEGCAGLGTRDPGSSLGRQ